MKFKKKKGIYLNKDAGDVKKSNAVFNNSTSLGTTTASDGGGAMGEDLEKANPYMLRNDCELIKCDIMHPYIKYVYESNEEAIKRLCSDGFFSLQWFYDNSLVEDTRDYIRIIVNYLIHYNMLDEEKGKGFDIKKDIYLPNEYEFSGFIDIVNANTNQEFLRVRTSALLFGGNSNEIYFRISSIRYNWFNNIWCIVNKYKDNISNITICKDSNTFNGKFEPYKVGGVSINHLPVDDFLTLPGNPIIESMSGSKSGAIEESNRLLAMGKSVSESYSYLHPKYASGFYHRQVKEVLEDDINHILRKVTEGYKEDITTAQKKAYDLLKKKNCYAVIYGYSQGKKVDFLDKPICKNSQEEVDNFVKSFKGPRGGGYFVVYVFYQSQMGKLKRIFEK